MMFKFCGQLCDPLEKSKDRKCVTVSIHGIEHDVELVWGRWHWLREDLLRYITACVALCRPSYLHICDGGKEEKAELERHLQALGTMRPLEKYTDCWLARTDPGDVARVEGKTFVCTDDERDAHPIHKQGPVRPHEGKGVPSLLGNWMSVSDMMEELRPRMLGCMSGRTMYVTPFIMGLISSDPRSYKVGVEVTDSAYVVLSMRIMTQMGLHVLQTLQQQPQLPFTKCMHSVGQPLRRGHVSRPWPCNPTNTIIAHFPSANEVISYGSGYGGNSLLGKKCLALRLGSVLARQEGWLAEHMLILGITRPGRGHAGKEYVTAAFPSQCGKTNLAMLTPTLPHYTCSCVGDDIAWIRLAADGSLRAINPEKGLFGVCPGTNMKTNPNAMAAMTKHTIFTNVGLTSDGRVYWEGIDAGDEPIPPHITITSWNGEPHTRGSELGSPAAHPNSRFCCPALQCPIIDVAWLNPDGVPIKAIIFGGRRPVGVPLVFEAFNWHHGVFLGAAMRSEATSAAEHGGKEVMHDPFGMRPFLGYNFGQYIAHWLSFAGSQKLPRIFHVNWFLKDADTGSFLWPGFSENCRVLDWILRRCDGDEDIGVRAAIGYVPSPGSIKLDGLPLPLPDMEKLVEVDKQFWREEMREVSSFFTREVGEDMPKQMWEQMAEIEKNLN